MTTRRAETSHESRRLLVEAAARLFAGKGYRQTTVADVADLAGISRGSIPWHFGSKEGLLLAVIEDTFLETTHSFSEHYPAGPDGLVTLTDQIEEFTRRPVTRLLISLLLEAVEPDSPIHHQYVELHTTMRRIIETWVAQPHNTFRLPDGVTPADFGIVMLAATIGIHQQWRMAPDRVDLHEAFRGLHRLMLSALTASGS